jgi:uncharacterized protein YjeT (DUF2065 family)
VGLDWTDLFAALAIVCIVEGVLPFINPSGTKRLLSRMASAGDRDMRIAGFISMAVGLTILFMVRS